MEVNIWSDIRCPFCYIGKRKFEAALKKFAHKDKIKVNWRSFELDPNLKTQPELSVFEYFVARKGVSEEAAKQMHRQVTDSANEAGLNFNFDKAIIANSFNAHRLIHFAKTKQLADVAEDQLFMAYFKEGKNIDDDKTLIQIGASIGLDENELISVLSSNAFAEEVKRDEMTAESIGVHGVPFFVFNDKYAVSGAQSPEIFLQTLEQSWKEFEKENEANSLITVEGESCSTEGNC